MNKQQYAIYETRRHYVPPLVNEDGIIRRDGKTVIFNSFDAAKRECNKLRKRQYQRINGEKRFVPSFAGQCAPSEYCVIAYVD